MSLEAEAQAHVYNKKRQFLEALKEYAAYLEKFYDDNKLGHSYKVVPCGQQKQQTCME